MTGAIRRVAALYDVHGNLPALEAALSEAEAARVDLIVLGGDIALGPMPCEVLDRVAELGDRVLPLRGNCDRLLVDACQGRLSPALAGAIRTQITWAAGQLRPSHWDLLVRLPETLSIEIESLGTVLFCHATPRSDEEVFTVRTPDGRLRAIMASVAQPIVICGHTHMQFDRTIGGIRVVNAGSVGMPFGKPGAHWLLAGPTLEPRRSQYALASAAERIARTGYPDAMQFAERHVLNPPTEAEMLTIFESAEKGVDAPVGIRGEAP